MRALWATAGFSLHRFLTGQAFPTHLTFPTRTPHRHQLRHPKRLLPSAFPALAQERLPEAQLHSPCRRHHGTDAACRRKKESLKRQQLDEDRGGVLLIRVQEPELSPGSASGRRAGEQPAPRRLQRGRAGPGCRGTSQLGSGQGEKKNNTPKTPEKSTQRDFNKHLIIKSGAYGTYPVTNKRPPTARPC